MKLFNYWRSSSSWRVRIALAHKGIEYDYVPVHLVEDGGHQHADWFKELNPAEQVPVLEFEDDHGNTCRLTQSMAIIGWLEERYPAPPLLPDDRYQRALAWQLAELVNAGIQPMQNLSVIQKLRSLDQDVKAWCREFITRGLVAYEQMLQQTAGEYSVGNEVSVADACLVPQLYNARRFELDLAPYASIMRVERNCLELPEFDATRPENMRDAQP